MEALNHITMQRVIVRMLYDAAFAKRVYAAPLEALQGLALTTNEIAMLHKADPRAWRLDPLRRARSLEALLEEYPASGALIAHSTPHVGALDAFFSSEAFHECIQERGRLAVAYGAYTTALGRQWKRPDIVAFATLETAIATCRRKTPSKRQFPVELAADISLLRIRQGALEAYSDLLNQLASKGLSAVAAVVSTDLMLQPIALKQPEVTILLENSPEGPSLSVLDASLGALLLFASKGAEYDVFLTEIRACGGEPGEEDAIARTLKSDGLITFGLE
jgi:hypothetical protein